MYKICSVYYSSINRDDADCEEGIISVCGAGACPFVVTSTALSWSGDEEGVTQVSCY